ncbi:MAG: hypothetical protein QFX35_04030 [Candidatus Verstraetearchaeota archaeon]|nr:hypothetical protein [Candidatus Verstraetearchaeota archaeon]
MRRRKGLKDRYELMQRIREFIEEINIGVSLVIVEGMHDEAVLRRMMLKTPIVRFCDSHMPRFEFVEMVTKNYRGLTVLILFDYDREGSTMANRMRVELEEGGVRIESRIREELGELLVREGIRRIEEIDAIFRKF